MDYELKYCEIEGAAVSVPASTAARPASTSARTPTAPGCWELLHCCFWCSLSFIISRATCDAEKVLPPSMLKSHSWVMRQFFSFWNFNLQIWAKQRMAESEFCGIPCLLVWGLGLGSVYYRVHSLCSTTASRKGDVVQRCCSLVNGVSHRERCGTGTRSASASRSYTGWWCVLQYNPLIIVYWHHIKHKYLHENLFKK